MCSFTDSVSIYCKYTMSVRCNFRVSTADSNLPWSPIICRYTVACIWLLLPGAQDAGVVLASSVLFELVGALMACDHPPLSSGR